MAAMADLYRDVDAELAGSGQTCTACGRCCDFAAFGHRLYVSTIELALLIHATPVNPAAAAADRCPYQQESQCTARERRALGCRVFSCESAGDEFEHDLYSRYHERIRQLHQQHRVAYFYADLPAAVTTLLDSRP